jgi:broad specificity phosphatase PhoE
MKLILARHGNTFEPGEAVVWTGATNDLPLAKEGIAQAKRLAKALLDAAIQPAAIYCGPLKRTLDYANLIATEIAEQEKTKSSVNGSIPRTIPLTVIDQRLCELDYGYWTGLTDQEVIERYGVDELEAWDQRSQWPQAAGWTEAENNVIQEIQSFFEELKHCHHPNDTLLIISSNGKLRYFLSLIPGEFQKRLEQKSFKVKTGNICILDVLIDRVLVAKWNSSNIS